MAEVQLKNIGKTYEGGMQAVKEVSLTIKDKEFIGSKTDAEGLLNVARLAIASSKN